MVDCIYFMKYLSINVLVLAIILFTSSIHVTANNANSSIVESINQSNCDIHRTCNQCVHNTCIWLVNKQKCVSAKSILEKSDIFENQCPKFKVLSELKNNIKHLKIIVENQVPILIKFLKENKIYCEVETIHYKVQLIDDTIICLLDNRLLSQTSYLKNKAMNPINIFYFSIYVNNILLQFDNVKDYYITYYGINECYNQKCKSSYWENESNRYYCKWCENDNKEICKINLQLNECDVRHLNNNTKITNDISHIEIQSVEFVIRSVEPTIGLINSKMKIHITVSNNIYLVENKNLTVTVAGLACKSIQQIDEDIICEITSEKVAGGLVKIVYSSISPISSMSTNVTLKSNQTFRFVEPKLNSFSPKCGPLIGQTLLNLNGEFLNITKNVNVSINNKTCHITKYESDRIQCKTDSSKTAESGKLKMVFNNEKSQISSSLFRYVDEPSVAKDQRYGGIVSGGTRLSVLGNFQCVTKPKMFIVDDLNKTHYFSDCTPRDTMAVVDSKILTCYTPTIEIFNLISPMRYRIGLTVNHNVSILSPDNAENHYVLYPDPVFMNFVVNNTTVTVYGEFEYIGDYQPSDLTVRIADTVDKCEVQTMKKTYIVCQMSYAIADVQNLTIAVGKKFKSFVLLKTEEEVFESNEETLTKPSTVLSKYSVATMIVALLFGLILCATTIHLVKCRKPSKKRYIAELQNITAGIDEKLL